MLMNNHVYDSTFNCGQQCGVLFIAEEIKRDRKIETSNISIGMTSWTSWQSNAAAVWKTGHSRASLSLRASEHGRQTPFTDARFKSSSKGHLSIRW